MRVIRSVQGFASYISSIFIFVICVLISSKKRGGGGGGCHAFHPSGFALDCIISNCRVRLVLQIYSSRYFKLFAINKR